MRLMVDRFVCTILESWQRIWSPGGTAVQMNQLKLHFSEEIHTLDDKSKFGASVHCHTALQLQGQKVTRWTPISSCLLLRRYFDNKFALKL